MICPMRGPVAKFHARVPRPGLLFISPPARATCPGHSPFSNPTTTPPHPFPLPPDQRGPHRWLQLPVHLSPAGAQGAVGAAEAPGGINPRSAPWPRHSRVHHKDAGPHVGAGCVPSPHTHPHTTLHPTPPHPPTLTHTLCPLGLAPPTPGRLALFAGVCRDAVEGTAGAAGACAAPMPGFHLLHRVTTVYSRLTL